MGIVYNKQVIKEKTIYDLKMHETLVVADNLLFTKAMRVEGGWIYTSLDKSHNIMSSVFVQENIIGIKEKELPTEDSKRECNTAINSLTSNIPLLDSIEEFAQSCLTNEVYVVKITLDLNSYKKLIMTSDRRIKNDGNGVVIPTASGYVRIVPEGYL